MNFRFNTENANTTDMKLFRHGDTFVIEPEAEHLIIDILARARAAGKESGFGVVSFHDQIANETTFRFVDQNRRAKTKQQAEVVARHRGRKLSPAMVAITALTPGQSCDVDLTPYSPLSAMQQVRNMCSRLSQATPGSTYTIRRVNPATANVQRLT